MPDAEHMQRFWDARARDHAEYYVDNRIAYGTDAGASFWEQGAADLDRLLAATGTALDPSLALLDVGCGVGRLMRAASPRVARVTGIDVSAEMVERARGHLADCPNAEVLVGDGTSLRPLADGSFDAVVSLVVFQHIPDPQITLGYVREVGRVLRPGGWAAFQVSNDPDVHSRDYPKPPLRQRLLGRAPKGQDDPAWRGSAVDLAALRAAAVAGGARVEAVVGEGTQYCLVRLRREAAPTG